MTKEFRKHIIVRNCTKEYKDYHSYRPYLEQDFMHRCAYCDMHDEWIAPLSFQIDHFIPREKFEKAGRTDLDNDYRNLMYACPACNRLKSDCFDGEIPEREISNPYLYNPVDVDYNKIFYRDEDGYIRSEDPLGRQMIRQLQLYRPTKHMAWLLDEVKTVYDELEQKIEEEKDSHKKQLLESAQDKLGAELYKRHRILIHSFKTEKNSKDISREGKI